MEFEYDSQKSEANKIKHGIDFEEAQEPWNDENAFEVLAKAAEEARYLAIGEVEEYDNRKRT